MTPRGGQGIRHLSREGKNPKLLTLTLRHLLAPQLMLGLQDLSLMRREAEWKHFKARKGRYKMLPGDSSPSQSWVHTVTGYLAGWQTECEWQGQAWREPSPKTEQTIWTRTPTGPAGSEDLCIRKRLLKTCFEELDVLPTLKLMESPPNSLRRYHCPQFTDEKTEAQGD